MAVAGATGQSVRDVGAALHSRGRLRKSGLCTLRHHGEVYERLELDSRLADLLTVERLGPDTVMERFLPVAAPPSLSLEDYAHLASEVTIAQQLLAAATRQRRAGTNVLLYGPTGTGKSELARRLARQLDLSLYIAGREDDDGDSPTVQDRLRSFMLGNRLLEGARALLLFDEMEDLFAAGPLARLLPHNGEGRVSKQWFNNLLETNPVPAVWISNDVSDLDPAFLRRFTYAIEVGAFTAGQRRRAWHKHLGGEGSVRSEEVERRALRFEVSPAQIGNAVAAARLADGGDAVTGRLLEAVLTPSERIVRGRRTRRHAFPAGRYLPEVANTPVNLEELTERLVGWGAERTDDGPGVSLCLYSPPGSGKSAYVAYLARRLDRPLLVRRPSDLLGAYVGETESSIAEAFQEALRDRAVLLFAEADTFLHDRRQAQRSWEVSQVNELVQQLELFAGLVVCTTNLFQTLDQASLRRFSFKIPFGYLRADQRERLFREALGGGG
jgi:transitional endoplasmic reticulum ATPase